MKKYQELDIEYSEKYRNRLSRYLRSGKVSRNLHKFRPMFTEKYLEIKDKLLLEMSLEEFNNWKYIDQYGNMSTEIQFTSDLRRELEKVERYDLLINLRDEKRKNSF